jgi:hypothetical protein
MLCPVFYFTFMSARIEVICPVSTNRVNENAARASAFFVITIAIIGLYLHSPALFAFLAADFALRAFTNGHYSLLKFGSKKIVTILEIKAKPTDAAPKKFAAGLGMAFSITIALLQVSGYYLAANLTGITLLFCALLEGAFGICLGCIVYTLFILPLGKK